MSTSDCLQSGFDFIEFLWDRKSTSRSIKDLRDIYNLEFKPREGIKDPSFSKVLDALLKSKRVHIRRGHVYIDVEPEVQRHCYQWRRPRAPQPPHSPNKTDETPAASSGPSSSLNPVLTSEDELEKIINKLKVNRKELTADKGGIQITSEPAASGEKVTFTVDRLGETFTVRFKILNKGTNCINFTFYTALHKTPCLTLRDERNVTQAYPVLLCPDESYEVEARYTPEHYEYYPTTICFEFCSELQNSVPFCIVRDIEAFAHSQLVVELGPVAPYSRRVVRYKPVKTMFMEADPPERSVGQRPKMAVKLREYRYPRFLKELAASRMEDTKRLSNDARWRQPLVKRLLDSGLNMKTHSDLFHLLLHLEEIKWEVDIRKYDLFDQTMTQDESNKKLLKLKVPGVAENRPSVQKGDTIMVSQSDNTVQPIIVYGGRVHKVEWDSVTLGFSKRFLQMFRSDMKFNVQFTFNRLTLQLQHRAVDLAKKHHLERMLFPSGVANLSMPGQTDKPDHLKEQMCNPLVENNPEQSSAVRHIVAGTSKPAPYLVFGPPGTGKTITLVEAMIQCQRASSNVSMADPPVHILACTPTNSACDLLCERLMVHMAQHQVYRLYAKNHDPRAIPKQLLKHCNWDPAQGEFVFPDKFFLMEFKIIVTTMFTAGRLVSTGVPVGHFTHVFMDEAGQAEEPECIIAVAGLLSAKKGQLVLAGDPKQLGPIIHSPLARKHGLGLSLLERLMTQNDLYKVDKDSGKFNPRFMTKLLRNYRSHPDILKIPNEKFYNNELMAFADQSEREAYCGCDTFSKTGFPVIYHGVMGKYQREGKSPSFFNEIEIQYLISYLNKLIDTQGKNGLPKLSAKDIGIIAPYRKQVEKIQQALKSVSNLKRLGNLSELKVGCVEEFQGQERKIIMVSTVRSSNSYIEMDKNIGFLANDKRFNVAITRAKSLLIVVGNPVIFSKEPTWRDFIDFCVKNGGYSGFDFKKADLTATLLSLTIHVDSEHPLSEESALEQKH